MLSAPRTEFVSLSQDFPGLKYRLKSWGLVFCVRKVVGSRLALIDPTLSVIAGLGILLG